MDISEIVSSVGGIFLLFYLLWQLAEKLFGNVQWFQKLKKKKLEEENKRQEEITKKIVEQVLPPIISTLEEKNKEQDRKLNLLVHSSNDVLRKDIIRIYYKYLPYKRILQYDKEFITVAYADYTAQNGNSFIRDLVKEINTWIVVRQEEDLK